MKRSKTLILASAAAACGALELDSMVVVGELISVSGLPGLEHSAKTGSARRQTLSRDVRQRFAWRVWRPPAGSTTTPAPGRFRLTSGRAPTRPHTGSAPANRSAQIRTATPV